MMVNLNVCCIYDLIHNWLLERRNNKQPCQTQHNIDSQLLLSKSCSIQYITNQFHQLQFMIFPIIFYWLLTPSICHDHHTQFLKSLNSEAYEWIGISSTNWQHSLSYCKFEEFEDELMGFISHLQSINQNFTDQTLSYVQSTFKNKQSKVKQLIRCLGSFSHTIIPFFEQKRKVTAVRKYISQYPQYSEKIFNKEYIPDHKGKELGKWLKGFMEYYYVHYVSESQTLSTVLLRSLSTKVEVLKNRDFSYCVSLDVAGKLSQQLENMDINNIFLKVPAVFNTLKYLHLKPKCQTQDSIQITRNLHQKIKDIDMFKIMYYDYEPYVTIATEKYGISKIKQLASVLSRIVNNAEEVRREQIIKLEEEKRLKREKGEEDQEGQL